MKHSFAITAALALLLGCSAAVPAVARPVHQDSGQTTTRRQRRAQGRANRAQGMQETPAGERGMEGQEGQGAMEDDTVFTTFQTNLAKTQDDLDKLTALLNQIIAHGGQNTNTGTTPPAGGSGDNGGG